jgi:hypothetical protein
MRGVEDVRIVIVRVELHVPSLAVPGVRSCSWRTSNERVRLIDVRRPFRRLAPPTIGPETGAR